MALPCACVYPDRRRSIEGRGECQVVQSLNAKDMDLAGYAVTRGRARNGSLYATLRKAGSPTLTGYGETADALVDAVRSGGTVKVEAYGHGKALKVASVSCPVTGLPVGERGRMEPTAIVPVVIEPEPARSKGFWARTVDALKELVGMDAQRPEPTAPVVENGRTGYPVIDALADRIARQVKDAPHLTDANGSRFDLLLERDIPRLASRHADTVRGASPEERRRADMMLEQAITVINGTLEEALLRERQARMDALTTELNYIRSRAGMRSGHDAMLSSIAPSLPAPDPEIHPALSAPAERRLAGIAKGPRGQGDQDDVVVHMHRSGRGGGRG